MWQDWVIAGCAAAFSWALVPQIVRGFRHRVGYVTWPTAAVTALGCYALAGTCLTLRLPVAAALDAACGAAWTVLLWQRGYYGAPRRHPPYGAMHNACPPVRRGKRRAG